jgi:hypothetical protein
LLFDTLKHREQDPNGDALKCREEAKRGVGVIWVSPRVTLILSWGCMRLADEAAAASR